MFPSVNVPVLSVQMLFTFPIVSEASRWRTKLFSSLSLITAKARAIVTAMGNPSGIATTITVTAMMNALTKVSSIVEVKIEVW